MEVPTPRPHVSNPQKSGGATAFPQMTPRPPYPAARPIIRRATVHFLRFTFLCTVVSVSLRPVYAGLLRW